MDLSGIFRRKTRPHHHLSSMRHPRFPACRSSQFVHLGLHCGASRATLHHYTPCNVRQCVLRGSQLSRRVTISVPRTGSNTTYSNLWSQRRVERTLLRKSEEWRVLRRTQNDNTWLHAPPKHRPVRGRSRAWFKGKLPCRHTRPKAVFILIRTVPTRRHLGHPHRDHFRSGLKVAKAIKMRSDRHPQASPCLLTLPHDRVPWPTPFPCAHPRYASLQAALRP